MKERKNELPKVQYNAITEAFNNLCNSKLKKTLKQYSKEESAKFRAGNYKQAQAQEQNALSSAIAERMALLEVPAQKPVEKPLVMAKKSSYVQKFLPRTTSASTI